MLKAQRLRYRRQGAIARANPAGSPVNRTIARGEVRTGDLTFDGTVHVEGSVEGDIHARRIIVGAVAVVDGALMARTIHVDGTVNGPLDGARISLGPYARVKGNLTYESLALSNGASVCGVLRDRSDEESPYDRDRAAAPLPFSVARAACRRAIPPLPDAPTMRMTPTRPKTMRAVWDSYLQERAPT